MKKKIVQILYSGLGGIASVVFPMIEADKERSVDWHLIFYGIEEIRPDYIAKCEKLNIPYSFYKKEKRGLDFSNYKKINKELLTLNPDFVFCHLPYLVGALRFFKSKRPNCQLVFIEHQPINVKSKLEWVSSRMHFSLGDKVIFLTEDYNQAIQKNIPQFYRKSKVKVIPNGVNTDFYKPLNQNVNQQNEQSQKENIVLGMMCRLTSSKDIPSILKALHLLKDKPYFEKLKFHLAGDGDKRAEWEQLCQDLQLTQTVTFLGMLGEDDLKDYLSTLDIYIQSTLGEAMCTAIMQAQSMGLPVIGSKIKGVVELIDAGHNGLLFESQNEQELANRLDGLITRPDVRRQLGKAARQYAVHRLSSKKMLADYLSLT